jgi:hypothetical protein
MATRIIEYGGRARHGDYPVIPASQKLVAQAAITASATPASSSAFDARTSIVCVQSDEAVYISFGASPTATTNDYRIQAAGEQFFEVQPGQSWMVSVRT